MFEAMRTEDLTSNKTRGYILIDDPNGHNLGDDSESETRVPIHVIVIIVFAAILYICFTTVAVIFICASIFAVIKNRGKRTQVAV